MEVSLGRRGGGGGGGGVLATLQICWHLVHSSPFQAVCM